MHAPAVARLLVETTTDADHLRCELPRFTVIFDLEVGEMRIQGGVAYPWLGDLIRLVSVGGAYLFVSASFHSSTGFLVVDACTKIMVMRGRDAQKETLQWRQVMRLGLASRAVVWDSAPSRDLNLS
ncbi:hypothetical protein B296_00036325 [Ensete ventricosum]|uniref:Uncharacterized protein n=1 Tax=Ensete ventricosum TaxID=4639 RepID=A0A426XLK8_ENSVE|nr:hypothetical protein B296_00036325 [Ensete ventricosum]